MSKPRLCHSCQLRPATHYSTECGECLGLIKERSRPRSFIPLFGSETRRLPNVGTCERHARRGCLECVKGEK